MHVKWQQNPPFSRILNFIDFFSADKNIDAGASDQLLNAIIFNFVVICVIVSATEVTKPFASIA